MQFQFSFRKWRRGSDKITFHDDPIHESGISGNDIGVFKRCPINSGIGLGRIAVVIHRNRGLSLWNNLE